MSLAEKLEAIREEFLEQAPPEAVEIVHRSVDTLRASGMHTEAVGVGADLPEFELPDTVGAIVKSVDLIDNGPLVLTFFRGGW